jgi:hypothetical protein
LYSRCGEKYGDFETAIDAEEVMDGLVASKSA